MIELRGVSKYYQNEGNVTLGLRKASLKLSIGEFVTITGESGSGKSTLLNVISGLDKYDEGEYFVNGEETSYFSVSDMERFRKEYVGFVFQNYNIIDSYTVYENVIAALVIQNYDKKKRKNRALELIEAVGLTKQRNQKTSKLSGGQKQRVVIARALAKDSPIIVADEPTGNLDSDSGEMVMKLLKNISKDKLVIVVTHNYEQVEPYTTRRIHMADGEIIEDRVFQTVEPLKIEPTKNELMGPKGQFYFAALNVLRQPKKTITLLLAFIVLMVAVLFVYASSFTNLSLYIQHPLTDNIYDTRVIVKNEGNIPFTQQQLDAFLNYREVNDIVHYDMTQETYFNVSSSNSDMWFWASLLRPASSFTQEDMVEGHIPTEANQIILSKNIKINGISIGDTIYLSSVKRSNVSYTFEVTGFHNDNNNVIGVSSKFLNQTDTNTPVTNSSFINMVYENTYSVYVEPLIGMAQTQIIKGEFVEYSDSVPLEEIHFNESIKSTFLTYGITEEKFLSATINLYFESENNYDQVYDLKAKFIYDGRNDWKMRVNGSNIQNLFFKQTQATPNTSQITLVAKDAANASNLYKRLLNDDTLLVMYPSSYEDPYQSNPFNFLFIILMFVVFFFAFLVINIITKNIYKAKNKDIAIMRSIGASKGDVRKIYLFEQTLTVTLAFIFSLIIVRVIEVYWIKTSILTYLGTFNILLVYLLFLGLGLYIIFKYLNKLFGKTVISTLKGGSDND
ncbi:MAG: ABC transporter ATP-binding protein/permease [Acholeplasmataceae bacterium]|nr:ABC transporter ATP-binding protein/permease [Acholeplasmataceae bacterium]